MLGPTTFKAIATNIVSPLVIVSRAFRDMFAVIKARVVRQTVHKRNLAKFVGDPDVEIAREKGGAPWTSCPGKAPSPITPTADENFDIKTGFFEVIDDRSFSLDLASRNGPTPPLPTPKNEALSEVTAYPFIYQRSSSIDLVRDISAQSARVVRARAKRHSILFGDGQKPGLSESITMSSDTSSNAPNAFAQSEIQQKRIRCARAIRHEKLFSDKTCTCSEVALSRSEGSDLALGAPALGDTPSKGVATRPEVVDCGIELDFGYFTAESCDDLPTPPSTPSRRARIVKSDSYGGSINYSLRRLSRNTQDFEDIVFHVKRRYEVSSTPMIARHPIDLSLSS